MLPNFKESRMASIEVLFEFFKAVPRNYYATTKKTVGNTLIVTNKSSNVTLKKELDLKTNGFNIVEISGRYLNPKDQKIFRAILESLYNQQESLFSCDNIQAKALNIEFIQEDKSSTLYSNFIKMKITDFYKIFNPKSKRSIVESYKKMQKSLQRLSMTTLSFYTEEETNNSLPEKILTAPLLIYEIDKEHISFQIHPCIMAYKFESNNDESLIPLKQSFYILNNDNFFNKKMTEVEQLIYSKIQYKFASMNSKYKSFTITLDELHSSLYIHSENSNTVESQIGKIFKSIKSLDNKFEYNIKRQGSKSSISFEVTKKNKKLSSLKP